MISLQGRVCVVTGAGRGIGRAVAEGFVKRGAIVVATDLQAPQVVGCHLHLAWDVAQPEAAERVLQRVAEQFGRIDVLVANAGIYPRQPWDEISLDDWEGVRSINLDGAWYGARAAAKIMQRQGYGKIVLVSSIEVEFGTDVHIHYTTSKAAIIGLTRSLARALGRNGVRVNAIMPGAVRTEGERELVADEGLVARKVAKKQCLPDRVSPEQVEPSFAFLCSEESDAVTGQVLCVDNGFVHY